MRDNELYGIVDPDELNKEWRNSHPYTDPALNSMPSGSGDIDRLVAQSKYTPEVTMSGEGPGMEKTIPPPQKEQLYRSIASKMNPAPPMEEYPMYNNPQRLYDAQELAGKNELLANLGQAGQTMVRGLTGFDGGDFYEKMREGAQRPVAQENARQASVAEYLKNKYEGGLKKKSYDLQLKTLEEQLRHNRETENIDKGKLAATLYKDSPNAPFAQRLARLGAEEKKAVANQKEALASIHEMYSALKNGQNTFTMYGDNDFTLAARKFEEAIGRLQSGGSINAEEGKRFRGFLPGKTDSTEMQQKKLSQAAQMMAERLAISGFSPEDFGLSGQIQDPEKESQSRQQRILKLEEEMKNAQNNRRY